MSEKWYTHSYRRNLVDMHIDDWSPEFLSEFDPQAYFECLQAAHIQTPMIYMQSHVGLCNWDTATGRMHKGWGGVNKIKQLFDLCHGAGMTVVGYYSLIYNNWAYDAHPEWRMLDADGQGSRETGEEHGFMSGSRYGLVCPNNMEYREFLKAQFKEIFDTYTMEGIFLDMTFWPSTCFCDNCRKKFREETGCEIPKVVDWNDPVWRRFQLIRQRWMGEFAAFCTDEIHALRPEVTVEHQFSTICHSWHFGVDEKVNNANDYLGGDLYGGTRSHSYISKIMREASANQPFEYMTCRCDPRLAVHTTTKSLYTLKLSNYLTLAHHGAFLGIDAIDPVGTMDRRVYDRLGEMFAESMPYEKYMVGDMVSEAAMLMSYDSKFDEAAPAAPDARASQAHPQLDAHLGLSEALTGLRMLHTVIPEDKAERILGKKLVFVTDAPQLREEELDILEQYVREGGSLYISGATDPRLAERLLGLKFLGFTEENITYVAPTAAGDGWFNEYTAKYPLCYEKHQYKVENPKGYPVLAYLTVPYTNPNRKDKFASIHSNPPGPMTEYPAAILGEVGKGRVLWLGFCPEKSDAHSVKEVTKTMIRALYAPQILSSDAHPCVEMTLFEDEKGYMLHAVNVQEQEPPLPVPGFTVTLAIARPVTKVLLAPEDKEIPFEMKDGKVCFALPAPGLFTTVRLEAE